LRAVIQRVRHCSVTIDDDKINRIENGLLVLVGIIDQDSAQDIDWLVRKILNLRIFNDEKGIMNKSVVDISGSLMLVSQFTLYASTRKGNRPSYIRASKPDIAIPIYNSFVDKCMESDLPVETGKFGADMKIELLNDGPITIIIDSKLKE